MAGSVVTVVVLVVSALTYCWSVVSVDAFGVVLSNHNNIGAGSRSNSNSNSNIRSIIGGRGSSPQPQPQPPFSSSTTTTVLCAALPSGYREFGNQAIRDAARQCGMDIDENGKGVNSDNNNRLDIDWKAGSIVVTVHGEVSLAAGGTEAEASEEAVEDDVDFDGDSIVGDVQTDGAEEEKAQQSESELFSLTQLARTINQILDDDGTGLAIAEAHSIEVTTPGVSDELVPGTPQFEAFKGFEVIVKQLDAKTNKVKTIEGRLVERNDDVTVVNIKGRMKKMKNETVQSVRLPKAKKEKGSR